MKLREVKSMQVNKIKAARGEAKAELVLKGGSVLNVFTEEIIQADVAIVGDTIVGIGDYEGEREMDCRGKYIAPGLIDGHVHIESSMVTPLEFARQIVRQGTTTIIADPHEIVNVSGASGLSFILDSSEEVPVTVYVMVPSSVPATDVDTNGAGKFLAADMEPFMSHPRVLGLGEMMRFMDVLGEELETMEKLQLFSDRIMDGHAPGITGKDVQAYKLAGIYDDHECGTAEEALEKLRAGFYILVREGSGAHNLRTLVKGFLEQKVPLEQCLFCTDDKHLEDIEKEGHINACVRMAIEIGVPVEKAYKMGSYYAAKAYGLKDAGAVAAGFKADLMILDDLKTVKPESVIKAGRLITEDVLNAYSYRIKDESLLDTVIFDELTKEKLQVKRKEKNHVMELVPYQLLTRHCIEMIPGEGEVFVPDSEYTKLCVVERHGKNGKVGVCPMKGYGIKGGAIATTVSHDSHNIIAAGDNDEDLILAVEELKKIRGGYVIASAGEVKATLPLEIGGLMSLDSAPNVQRQISKMDKMAREMGVKQGADPFTTLSFMALTVIPQIRLTEKGMYDVETWCFVKE
ncbi:Adenine deaminase [Hespellia stercorisuis DSM 15480]|uniref:Adenine deaminase n=2 Tax=Hespellia stercorisuis TaxID=180311 RepID=A0A1M6TS15_9FIRM|nr:Adenine deaminase [Hespellia stercorisuis DSM 15480]